MELQLINLRQHRGGFVLQSSALGCVVFRRILARAVFEIQVAKILVQHVFLFAQKVEARLSESAARYAAGDKRRRQRWRAEGRHRQWCSYLGLAADAVAGGGKAGRIRLRRHGHCTELPIAHDKQNTAIPRNSISGGMIQAKWLKRVNIGEARITGPYCSWNWWKMASSLSPLAMLADSCESIYRNPGSRHGCIRPAADCSRSRTSARGCLCRTGRRNRWPRPSPRSGCTAERAARHEREYCA